jgi:acyl-CoA dehydrogenase
MEFAFDDMTIQLRERLLAFMDECVYPAEPTFREQVHSAGNPWATPPVIEELKLRARERGLWNLFLPRTHEFGAGLTNLQYAPPADHRARRRPALDRRGANPDRAGAVAGAQDGLADGHRRQSRRAD